MVGSHVLNSGRLTVTRTAGGPVYHIKDTNKALTKIIKYFSRAVDDEVLHLDNETGTSLLFFPPSKSIRAPICGLPVELWQDILLLAIGSNEYRTFATTCTASTFLHFLEQEKDPHSSYLEYVGCRATLRQVCRAWNEFLESTDTWWVHAEDPYHPQKSFDLPPLADQVTIVKRLSMTITTRESVGPTLNWASDLFQRVQAPILSYNINLEVPYDPNVIDKPYDLLAPVSTKMALRSLRIASSDQNNYRPISLSQLNANFKNLVSLSLSGVTVRSTKKLALPQLEFLYIHSILPSEGWDLPRLRHVYLASGFHGLIASIDSVRRYVPQLESLFLEPANYSPQPRFPGDFWESFPVLRLFGLPYVPLRWGGWGGWAVPPPRSHPFRYLVSESSHPLESTVNKLIKYWTYHDGVSLVVKETTLGVYHLIEDVELMELGRRTREKNRLLPLLPMYPPNRILMGRVNEDVKRTEWRRGMRETNGILPIRPPARGLMAWMISQHKGIDLDDVGGRIFEPEKWKTERVREREKRRRQAINR